MTDLEKYMIAEESLFENFKISVSNINIGPKVKALIQKLLPFLKKKKEMVATEGLFFNRSNVNKSNRLTTDDMATEVGKWVIVNLPKIHAEDKPNSFHIIENDNSREMKLAKSFLQCMKHDILWEKSIPLMTLTMTMKGEEVLLAFLRADWNSMDVIAVGVPVVLVDRPFSKILEEIDKSSKSVKVDITILMEVHWDVSMGRNIDQSPYGKTVIMLGDGTIDISQKK